MEKWEDWKKQFAEAVEIEISDFEGSTELASIPTWDSMAALQVIALADIEYELELTGDQLKACKCVKDVFKLFTKA